MYFGSNVYIFIYGCKTVNPSWTLSEVTNTGNTHAMITSEFPGMNV